jgi:prepilin-type N-terminal cleavage/methylation domain-containing protein
MKRDTCQKDGFTLIEILVVIILLGILATIIIPQISVSSEDAKLNSLKTNLSHMRDAIRLYYAQHNNIYPGANYISGLPSANGSEAAVAFVRQLTRYTKPDGEVQDVKDATHNLGPYLKVSELPINPYNNRNDLVCDITTIDITSKTSDGTSGWKFYTKTGILIANDGAHDNL